MGFASLLGSISGSDSNDVSEKLLFNNVIGFRGITDGVGTSTIIQGLAHAFSDRTHKRVCVVDTHILYPSQYGFLCNPFSSDVKSTLKDWFSAEVPLPVRIIDTRYKRISLLGCYNRRITDAFSTSDSMKLVDKTFDKLKDLFDVILVDLSHEFTQLSACAALKCNRIYTVVDPSATCVNNITQSLNNFATSAIPFGKFRNTIINKYTVKGILGLDDVLKRNKLNPIVRIPYSEAIFINGTLGRSNWGDPKPDYGIDEYNVAIDTLLCSIVNETPLEIIDLKEQEELELAIQESGIKNKNKARKIEMRKRNALLSPKSEDEKEAIKLKRKNDIRTKVELRNKKKVSGEEDLEEVVEDGVSIDTLVDDTMRDEIEVPKGEDN